MKGSKSFSAQVHDANSLSPEHLANIIACTRYGGEKLPMIDPEDLIDQIEHHGIDHKMWWNNSTALMLAAFDKNTKLADALIEAGADITLRTEDLENTALMIAAESGSLEIVRALIRAHGEIEDEVSKRVASQGATEVPGTPSTKPVQYKAGILAQNKNGQTALMLAIEAGHIHIVKELLKYHRETQRTLGNKWGKIPLIVACECGQKDVVPLLVDLHIGSTSSPHHSAEKINGIANRLGITPLMYACIGDTSAHREIAKFLLNINHIDVKATTTDGKNSALTFACMNSSYSLIKSILAKLQDDDLTDDILENSLLNLCGASRHPSKVNGPLRLLNERLDNLKANGKRRNLREIRKRGLIKALKHGHIEIATMHFMYHPNFSTNTPKDMFTCKLRDILTTEEDRAEMLRRLYCNEHKALDFLVKLAAFYDLHFDILTLLLKSLDSRIAILDDYMPIFYQCLEYGAKASVLAVKQKIEFDAEIEKSAVNALCSSPVHQSVKPLTFGQRAPRLMVDKDSASTVEEFYHQQKGEACYDSSHSFPYEEEKRDTAAMPTGDDHFDDRHVDGTSAGAVSSPEGYVKSLTNSFAAEGVSYHDLTQYSYLRGVYGIMPSALRAVLLPAEGLLDFPNHLTDIGIVNKLVELASLLTAESSRRSMERVDIKKHLEKVEGMLVECFRASAFSHKETMQKFLPPHNFELSVVRNGHAFECGPLATCIKNRVSVVFNSGHVNSFVDSLYWGFTQKSNFNPRTSSKLLVGLRSSLVKWLPITVYNVRAEKIVQLRTNLLFSRFNPASMFFAEGLSKLAFLLLIVRRSGYMVYPDWLQTSITVMVFALCLYEYGEFCDNKFMAWPRFSMFRKYFGSRWNCIDCFGYMLVIGGLLMDYNGTSNSRGAFALATIFTSLSMLNYCSAYEPIGQLVIMVFAMMTDLAKFVAIFCICIFGFCVAMYSLAHNQEPGVYASRTRTFLAMFNAAFANYDSFDDQFESYNQEYRELAIGIELVYIIFSAVILLNLVIARMSATHDKIDQKAFEEWQYTRAETVYNFLLLEERNPTSMHPAPLNLVTVVFGLVFDYPNIVLKSIRISCRSNADKKKKEQQQQQEQHKDSSNLHEEYGSLDTEQCRSEPILCVSGTVCNWMIGVFVAFVGPWLELLRYCYESLIYGSSLHDLYEFCILVGLFLFPIYPIYVFSLLFETFHLATFISVERNDEDEKSPSGSKWCYPISYDETFTPNTTDPDNYISVKVIRVVGAYKYLAASHLPVLSIRLQDIVCYTGQAILAYGNSFVFPNSFVKFPLSQINWDKEVHLSVVMLDNDALTGKNEVIASVVASQEKVRLWMANGRFEDSLSFRSGRGQVQMVVKLKISDTALLPPMREENGLSSVAIGNEGGDYYGDKSASEQHKKSTTSSSRGKARNVKSLFDPLRNSVLSPFREKSKYSLLGSHSSQQESIGSATSFQESIDQQTLHSSFSNEYIGTGKGGSVRDSGSSHSRGVVQQKRKKKLLERSSSWDRLHEAVRQGLFSDEELDNIFSDRDVSLKDGKNEL